MFFSGKDGSHDTILMLFQNLSDDSNEVETVESPRPRLPPDAKKTKVLNHVLPCQTPEKVTNMGREQK